MSDVKEAVVNKEQNQVNLAELFQVIGLKEFALQQALGRIQQLESLLVAEHARVVAMEGAAKPEAKEAKAKAKALEN